MTTYATDTFDGDGSKVEFELTFDYIERDHVEVSRVITATKKATVLTVIKTGDPGDDEYIWETDKKVKVGKAPSTDEQLVIERDTPEDDQIVKWADGSYIIATDLNTSDLQWLYGLQELEDKYGSLSTTAIKYFGAIDLTTDEPPDEPEGGTFYINTGSGVVLDSWTGIGGDDVVGSEQVVYNGEKNEWEIFQVPSSQTGVIEVNVTAPITRDVDDPQRPIIGIDNATADADGAMSSEDKAKLDALPDAATGINLGYTAAADQGTVTNTAGDDAVIPYATATNAGLLNEAATPGSGTVQYAREVTDAGVASWATVDIPPGTIVDDTEPADPDDGQLWFNTDNNVLWVWDDDNSTWNPAMRPSPTGGGEDYANGVINEKAIFENVATIEEDYQISDNHNALSAGPITIADGTTVTVGDDETWTVVGSQDGVDPAGFWERDGTTLSPANDGDDLDGIGTITADGAITAGPFNAGSDDAAGIELDTDANGAGISVQQRASSGGTNTAFRTRWGTDVTASINYDGSVNASGDVNINNGTQVHLSRPDGTQTQFVQSGDMAFDIRSGTNNVAGRVFSVSGAGDVTASGEIRTNQTNGDLRNFQGELDGTPTSRIFANGTIALGTDVRGADTTNISLNGATGVLNGTITRLDSYLIAGAAAGGTQLNSAIDRVNNGNGTLQVKIGTATIQTTSDIRLKNKLRSTPLNATEKLNQVEIFDFTWKDNDIRNYRGQWTGFSAQQLHQVLPFCVHTPTKEDGSVDYEMPVEDAVWCVDSTGLLPVLVKALQEQSSRIEALEAKLAALSGPSTTDIQEEN